MQQAIEERNRGRLHGQEMAPLLEWPVAGHAQAAPLIGGGHETEQQLATRVIQRSEAELVDQQQLVAQESADHLAHRVVGQTAVQGLDQVSGDQVADLHAAFHGAHATAHEGVAFAGARRSDQQQILLGVYPFERGEVLKGRAWDRGLGHLERLQGLDDGEAALFESNATIGRVARGDFRLEQRTQHLLGTPALRHGRLEHLGGLLAHGRQLETTQRLDQVRRERRSGWGNHTLTARRAYASSERTGTSGRFSASCWPARTGVGRPRPASRMARTSLALKRRKRAARPSAVITASRVQTGTRSTMAASSCSSRSVPAAAAVRRNVSAVGPRPTNASSAAVRGRMPRVGRRSGSARSPKATSPGPTGSWRTTSAPPWRMTTCASWATTSTHSPTSALGIR